MLHDALKFLLLGTRRLSSHQRRRRSWRAIGRRCAGRVLCLRRVLLIVLADLRLRAVVRLVEHRRLLCLCMLAITPVLDPESILEVAENPHLAYDIPVKREVGCLNELHNESRA